MKKIKTFILFGIICFTLVWFVNNSQKDNRGAKLIINKLSASEKIIIKDEWTDNKNIIKTVINKTEIEEIINIMSRTDEIPYGSKVTAELNNWTFVIYDKNDNLISTIRVWHDGRISFEDSTEARRISTAADIDALKKIVNIPTS